MSKQFYEDQGVHFPFDEDYSTIQEKDIKDNKPHFWSLRQKAITEAKGKDWFGITYSGEVILFPVSQKHIKPLFDMVTLDGDMDVQCLDQAVGWAPIGMPFIGMSEHWNGLRKNVAGVFHQAFMNQYFDNFKTAIKHGIESWGDFPEFNLREAMHEVTYESASIGLFGSVINADIPMEGGETTHFKKAQHDVIKGWVQHAVNEEYYKDKDYRLKSEDLAVQNLVKNYGTVAGAVEGLAVARVGQLDEGAKAEICIVDAAIGLLKAGIIESAGELVNHGYALLNGMNQNMSAAITATIYFLLKNDEVREELVTEIRDMFDGKVPTLEDLDKEVDMESVKDLELLNLVVKEAMRISPAIYGKLMVPKKDLELDGFNLKKDTKVFPCSAIIGMSNDIWQEPSKFEPRRFESDHELAPTPSGDKRHPITWLAFGAGSRSCMGSGYAQYQIKATLIYILTQYSVSEIGDLPTCDHFYFGTENDFKVKLDKR